MCEPTTLPIQEHVSFNHQNLPSAHASGVQTVSSGYNICANASIMCVHAASYPNMT